MELKNDRTLTIKRSDKGVACVILDNKFYKEKMMEILNDKNTYKKLDKNIDSSTMNNIKKLTKEHETELTTKEIKHLTGFKYQSS